MWSFRNYGTKKVFNDKNPQLILYRAKGKSKPEAKQGNRFEKTHTIHLLRTPPDKDHEKHWGIQYIHKGRRANKTGKNYKGLQNMMSKQEIT